MNLQLHPLTVEPPYDHDPFGPEDSMDAKDDSPESLRSFWIGLAGMAILLHAVIYLELRTTSAVVGTILKASANLPNAQPYWDAKSAIYGVSTATLMPCLVLVTVVPLLYWRGGLLLRFVLSGTLIVTAMNLSVSNWWLDTTWTELQGLLAIAGCWAMFPILFLLTPIKTRKLRLIAGSCMLILTVCVSILNMNDLRGGFNVLYWECVFGSAFLFALLKRNWGRVAMMEADSTADQIERTSSRTLLELMALSGLAMASIGYWTQSSLVGEGLYFAQACALGIASALAGMACIKRLMSWKWWHLFFLLFAVLMMAMVFSANGLLLQVDRGYGSRAWDVLQKSSFVYPTVAYSICASLWLVLYLVLLSLWLKWCGWRMEVGGRTV